MRPIKHELDLNSKLDKEIIFARNNEKYIVDKNFDIKYLTSIGQYVQWKLENNHWDDYNKLYHTAKLIEDLKKNTDIWFDTHCLLRDDLIIGVVLIVAGNLPKVETKYEVKEESLLLKYFHIADKGRGY